MEDPAEVSLDASSDSEYSYIGSDNSRASEGEDPLPIVASEIVDAVDVSRLDRALVMYAQLSGKLNALSIDLTELEESTMRRVEELKSMSDRARAAQKSLAADIPWLKRHIGGLYAKARASHPIEFAAAQDEIDPHTAL